MNENFAVNFGQRIRIPSDIGNTVPSFITSDAFRCKIIPLSFLLKRRSRDAYRAELWSGAEGEELFKGGRMAVARKSMVVTTAKRSFPCEIPRYEIAVCDWTRWDIQKPLFRHGDAMVQAPGTERCPSPRSFFPSSSLPAPFFLSLLLSIFFSRAGSFPSADRSPECFRGDTNARLGRVVHTWTFNFALFEAPFFSLALYVAPVSTPVPSSRLSHGIAQLPLLHSWYVSALSLSLARHNYYLPDTHHRLIPRVFHDHNKYRLMTESAPRPFAPSSFLHRENYLVVGDAPRVPVKLAYPLYPIELCSYSYSHQLNAIIRCPYADTRAVSLCARATVILRPDASAIVRIGRHRTLASLQNDTALTPLTAEAIAKWINFAADSAAISRGDRSVILRYERAAREAILGIYRACLSPTLYRIFIVTKK